MIGDLTILKTLDKYKIIKDKKKSFKDWQELFFDHSVTLLNQLSELKDLKLVDAQAIISYLHHDNEE